MCKQDATASAAGRGRGGVRRASAGAGKQKTSLDDASWSCDDEVIVTTECPASTRSLEDNSGSQLKVGCCRKVFDVLVCVCVWACMFEW